MPATGDPPDPKLVAEGRCGRWKRKQVGQSDGRCRRTVATPGGACYLHGAKSLRGAAHPRFSGGETSKYMPAKLREDYERAANDPARFSFEKGAIAMLTLAADRWRALDKGLSEEHWRVAVEAMKRMRKLHDEGDAQGAALALSEVERSLLDGWDDVRAEASIRHELVTIYDKHRLMAEAEVKRAHRERLVMTAEQAVLLQNRILDLLSRRVLPLKGGRNALSQLQGDLQREAARWDRTGPAPEN